jgi:hypothetical protein
VILRSKDIASGYFCFNLENGMESGIDGMELVKALCTNFVEYGDNITWYLFVGWEPSLQTSESDLLL